MWTNLSSLTLIFLQKYGVEMWFISITVIILLYPPIRYIYHGCKQNKDDIFSSIDDTAKKVYLDKTLKMHDVDDENVVQQFSQIYYQRYGRARFFVPLIILLMTSLTLSALVAEFVIASNSYIWKPNIAVNGVSVAAISGAYLWVVSDFISRSRRLDFSPSDVLSGALRLLISAAVGWSFGTIVKEDVGVFVAFGLGAFPLQTIQLMFRQLMYRQLKLEIGPQENNELLLLNGIDKSLADRLANEDITSICQLAYCDPIQLTMSSNLTFNVVVDLVSQALGWVYLEEKMLALRPLGIRGAYEVRALLEFIDDADSMSDKLAVNAAKAVLPKVASVVTSSIEEAKFVLYEIGYDPYTEFIYET